VPELPEVETVAKGLAGAISGKVIEHVTVNRRDLRRAIPDGLEKRLTGKRVKEIKRRGKYIIIEIRGENTVILHLGMSGRIRIYAPDESYEPVKHDHVILSMRDGSKIVFNDPRRFGMLYISESKDWQKDLPFSQMGPEPLDNWSARDLFQKLSQKKVPIKNALLDQGIVAGLGNIYVCEALFEARIDPRRLSSSLSLEECDSIIKAVKSVLERAIKAGGSTLKDYRHVDGSLGYFQNSLSVYDREGQDCANKQCGDKIRRITQSSRSSFYCPSCQNAHNN